MNDDLSYDLVDTFLAKAQNVSATVLGDVMLDRFIWGDVERISPEAPVPIARVVSEENYPGGAANVARNLAAFTSQVSLLSIVGDDFHGKQLLSLLKTDGVNVENCIALPNCETSVKTRVISGSQHIVRVDRDQFLKQDRKLDELIFQKINKIAQKNDALIIQDYAKGLINAELCEFIAGKLGKREWQASKNDGLFSLVDPNIRNPLPWRGVSAIKPNKKEALSALKIADKLVDVTHSNMSPEKIIAKLQDIWQCDEILLTLGADGVLWSDGKNQARVPCHKREVYDVSGAGDTTAAIFALARSAGFKGKEASALANCAAGVVVRKVGTATLTADELQKEWRKEFANFN